MIRTLVIVIASAALALPATAHADQPPGDPVQCKPAGNYGMTVCRYADGSVTTCGAWMGCKPLMVALAPGFWDQP